MPLINCTKPGGFAVATDAYALHLRASGVAETIRTILSSIDVENVSDQELKSAEIRAAVLKSSNTVRPRNRVVMLALPAVLLA